MPTWSLTVSVIFIVVLEAKLTFQQAVCPPGTVASNVAVNKSAEQSSTDWLGEPQKAVDGNFNQRYNGNSCSHTLSTGDYTPWFQVDLGKPYTVLKVQLYPREDKCCVHRYHNVEVRVGNAKETTLNKRFSLNKVCNFEKGTDLLPPGKIFTFHCPPNLVGQFVSVQIIQMCKGCLQPDTNMLMICELVVEGC